MVPHRVEATCLSRAATSIRAELPLGKAPTTRVRRRISRIRRSSWLLVGRQRQCSGGREVVAQRLADGVLYDLAALASFIARSFSTTMRAFSLAAWASSWAWMALLSISRPPMFQESEHRTSKRDTFCDTLVLQPLCVYKDLASHRGLVSN